METLYCGDSNNCAGYCKRHHVGLTVKQLKQRECLKKQCRHFERKEDHMYWTQRAAVKRKKKEKRNMMNEWRAQ